MTKSSKPSPSDRRIARLEARVEELTKDRDVLARAVRRLTRENDDLALQLEYVR